MLTLNEQSTSREAALAEVDEALSETTVAQPDVVIRERGFCAVSLLRFRLRPRKARRQSQRMIRLASARRERADRR